MGDMEGSFTFNAAKPLECTSGSLAVLVDEASMLDMSLAAALLDALPTDRPVQLILVGAAKPPYPAFPLPMSWLALANHSRLVGVPLFLVFFQ